MKIELIKKNDRLYLKTGDDHKEEIMRDVNESDLEYINKAYIIFDRRVAAYDGFSHEQNEEIIKSVNI